MRDAAHVRLERDGTRVRVFTRNGHDWTDRFTFIVEAAGKLRRGQFIVDGEAVVLGIDGISDFEALRSRQSAVSARRLGYINSVGLISPRPRSRSALPPSWPPAGRPQAAPDPARSYRSTAD